MSYEDTLGQNLRNARKLAGFSLETLEISTKGEFKASAVGAYERGDRNITVVKFAALCWVYGISPREVLPSL